MAANRPSNSKTRNWCFTVNNPSIADCDLMKTLEENLESSPVRYLIYGNEIAPTTNTPHWQGFIVFKNSVRFNTVKSTLPKGAHIEKCQGTATQNIDYCTKDNNYVEFGDRPHSAGSAEAIETRVDTRKRKRIEEANAALVHVQKGDWEGLKEADVLFFVQNCNKLEKMRSLLRQEPTDCEDMEAIWIYGKSGVGKTTYVYNTYPEHYKKMVNRWWDNYKDQETVIIDDVDPQSMIKYHFGYYLKIWAHQFKFGAEYKGGSFTIRPKRLIVTSQYKIIDCCTFEGKLDEETYEALNRRFIEYEYRMNLDEERVLVRNN